MDEYLRMMAGIDDAVVAPQEFLATVLGYRTELIVHISDLTLRIGDRHDGMLIHGGLQVVELLERGLQILFSVHEPEIFHGITAVIPATGPWQISFSR